MVYVRLLQEAPAGELVRKFARAFLFYTLTLFLGYGCLCTTDKEVLAVIVSVYIGTDIIIGVHRINQSEKYKFSHIPMFDPLPLIIYSLKYGYRIMSFILFNNEPAEYYNGDL